MKTAEQWISEGNNHCHNQLWQKAFECYNHAIEQDPKSEACVALEMIADIMNFENRQMLDV